jgi:hypothetical protein
MSELRQKMIRAMELKNLSPHTQRAYLAAVTRLARHYRQPPTAINKEMIEDYLLLLKKHRASNKLRPGAHRATLFLRPRGRRKTAGGLPHAQKNPKATHCAHKRAGRKNHRCQREP